MPRTKSLLLEEYMPGELTNTCGAQTPAKMQLAAKTLTCHCNDVFQGCTLCYVMMMIENFVQGSSAPCTFKEHTANKHALKQIGLLSGLHSVCLRLDHMFLEQAVQKQKTITCTALRIWHMWLVLLLRLQMLSPTAVELTSPFRTCSEKTSTHVSARSW